MKTFHLLLLIVTLFTLPLSANSEPAASAYDSQDLELEGSLHELKNKAEAGEAAAMRQVYLHYAARGHMEQAQAWAARYVAGMEQAAEGGNARAMLMLGTDYLTGKDFVKPDAAKAVTWLLRAADAGEASAAYILGDFYARQGDSEQSRKAYERAYNAYSKLAEEQPDNADALYCLGYMQQNGLGTPADGAAGIARLEQASQQGSTWAASQLFKTYSQGIGTEKDEARAITYARQLADSGQDGLMAYATALAYLNGQGVEQDEATGEHYLNLAARANIPDAIYLKGRRLQQAGKAAEALACYTQAASMSQENALIEAALMLLYGEGTDKDEARGLSYLQTANHRLGSPRATYELARYYESKGEQELADDWYITASEAGVVEAMARRGLLHLNPFSKVSWSITDAYQWWRIGKDNGDKECTLYQRLFIYVFCPLVLIIVFGLPICTVRLMKRKAEQEEKSPSKG